MKYGTVFGVAFPRTHALVTSRAKFLKILLLGAIFLSASQVLAQSPPIAWVVNNLSETLSEVDLSSGQVITNAISLGSIPNDIIISGDKAYVVNSGSNHVQIIDLSAQQTLGTIELYLGLNPYFIVLDGEDRAFVSNWMTGNVSVLDLDSMTEIDTINTGGVPQGLCIVGDWLFISDVNYDFQTWSYGPGRLLAYSLTDLSFLGEAVIGTNPQVIEYGPDGRLHVVCTGNFATVFGQVQIINPTDLAIEHSVTLGGSPGSIAFTSDGTAYLGAAGWTEDGYVYSYNGISYAVYHDENNPILVPSAAMDVAVTNDDHVLVCCFNSDHLAELDASGSLHETYLVGDGPLSVGIHESSTGIKPTQQLQKSYSLSHNFPEPFNSATVIVYNLKTATSVSLEVFDIRGRLVESRDLGFLRAGIQRATFTPRSDLASGMYWYRLETGSSTIKGSMLFLK
ncbi:MAG TPA: T9SS type A sorting domain-containing protein [Bacteroidetes bacterium]|nr:T9SS type A sorting domain-containing protein [Bacteroidota bacterium]